MGISLNKKGQEFPLLLSLFTYLVSLTLFPIIIIIIIMIEANR